jgi:hypothetical protein
MNATRVNIPGVRRATASVRLAADVWVLVLVTEVEAEIVDDVAGVLDDVGTLLEVSGSSVAADILELGDVVGVGGGGEAGEDALLGEEEGSGADGEDGALSSWVLLLELGEVDDEAGGLLLLGQDLGRVAAQDDEDVKLLKALVGLPEGDLRAYYDTLAREHLGLGAGESDLEGLGSW